MFDDNTGCAIDDGAGKCCKAGEKGKLSGGIRWMSRFGNVGREGCGAKANAQCFKADSHAQHPGIVANNG